MAEFIMPSMAKQESVKAVSEHIAKHEVISSVDDNIRFYKSGYIALVCFIGYTLASSGNVQGVVPSGYRPTMNWRGVLTNGDGNKTAGAFIKTNGDVFFDLEASNMTVYGSIAYIIDA